jgi:hypothetical protein
MVSEESLGSPHLLLSAWRGGEALTEGRWRYDLEREEVRGQLVVVEENI